MSTDIDAQVAVLQQMTLAGLRDRYAEVFGEPTVVTNNKAWLVKRIAWRLQALAEGGLSERARRRAEELAQDADLRILPPRRPKTAPPPPSDERNNDRLLAPGTVLTRPYKGRTLLVKVLSQGFEHEGRVYSSLSALAKAITGSHC